MKLIIDIPDDVYENIEHGKGEYINTLNWAVRNGTPISNDGDLISRSELKKKIEMAFDYTSVSSSVVDVVSNIIDNAPTVEYPFYREAYQTGYEEGKNDRPQGEWVEVIDYSDEYEKRWHYECSKCKNAPYYGGDIGTLHFCPNCGADMRGDNNGKSSN